MRVGLGVKPLGGLHLSGKDLGVALMCENVVRHF